MHRDSKGMLFGVMGVSVFALTLPATRFVVPYFEALFIGLGRVVLAAIVAALLLLLLRPPVPTCSQWVRIIVVALGVVVGFPVLSTWAMHSLPAAHGGVVLGLLPLMTAVIGVVLSNERPSQGFWLASVVGSLLVMVFSYMQGIDGLSKGDAVLLGAALLAAIGYAVGGLLSKELGGWQVTCWSLVVALPFVVFPAASHVPSESLAVPASAWLAFLYLALMSQLIGFFLWNRGLAMGGVARVSHVQLLQPFITLAASFVLLGEVVDITTILFALGVATVVLIGKRAQVSCSA